MPAPTTDGTAVPVALLPDPWANQLAYASQMGAFDFSDVNLDPRTYLPDSTINPNDADGCFGLNLIILNSTTSPLKLVETQAVMVSGFAAREADTQICYPTGSLDGSSKNHEIPAAQFYPVQSKHLDANGGPAMLAGLGFYRFDTIQQSLWRAFSFQLGDDDTQHIGVVVTLDFRSRGAFQNDASFGFAGVTADLETEYTDLATFFNYKMPNPKNTPWGPPCCSQSARDRGALTVWSAPFMHDQDRLGTNSVVVWVRDVTSTVGL